jgi:hypothetical protein
MNLISRVVPQTGTAMAVRFGDEAPLQARSLTRPSGQVSLIQGI